jgi:predicted lipoprotein with Yx(FWY)xxD motif
MNMKSLSLRRRFTLIVAAAWLAAMALVVAGCGGSMSSSPTTTHGVGGSTHASAALVSTRMIKGRTVLVNNRGFTLYTFAPDQHKRVTCTGSCAAVWPPLKLKAGQKPTASGAAQAAKLASDKNSAGGNVVTYAGWPLYTYTADTMPGEAKGQGLNLNGGVWHVITPTGMVIMNTVGSGSGSTSGGTSTSSGGGGGWG